MFWIVFDFVIVVLSLGAGVASILLAMRMNTRYQFNYLNTFMYYQILLFIFGLYGLLGTLFIRNVVSDYDIPQQTIKYIAEFIPYLGIPVIITAWFLFVKMSFEMVGKAISKFGGLIYFGSIIISLFFYVLLIIYYFGEGSSIVAIMVDYAKIAFAGLYIITLLIGLFVMFRYGIKLNHMHTRRMVIRFAIICFLVSCFTMLVFKFTVSDTIIEKLYMLMFFAGQLPAVVFLVYYLHKNFTPISVVVSKQDGYNTFILNYQLTKREWEIVEKICEGLSNGQISDNLFISLQTVKDHIHRIYKKTGVKNRVQLVNMIRSLD